MSVSVVASPRNHRYRQTRFFWRLSVTVGSPSRNQRHRTTNTALGSSWGGDAKSVAGRISVGEQACLQHLVSDVFP